MKVFSNFMSGIDQDAPVGSWLPDGESVRMGHGIPQLSQLRDAAAMAAADLGLRAGKFEPSAGRGRDGLILPDGRVLPRLALYALAEIDSDAPIEAAKALMRGIAERHGPGRIWFLAPPSYLQKRHEWAASAAHDEVGTWRLGTETCDPVAQPVFADDPRRCVLVGCYYFHENPRKEPA